MTDFISQSGRSHTNNWLKNGNLVRVPRYTKARSYNSLRLSEVRPAMTIADAVTPDDLSRTVDTAREERFLANWAVYGSADGVGSIDLDPMNSKTGLRLRSFDSGRFLRLSFFKTGTITLEQEVEIVNQFRWMPATAAYSAYRLDGEVKIETEIDFGTEILSGVPYFSSNVGAYRRITHEVEECPPGLEKIVFRIKVSGDRGESVGLSGFVFALGAYTLSLPYSEAQGDVMLPRGSVILWSGDSCPPGFREVAGAEESFLYQTYGDPNVMNGGTQEYPDIRRQAETADEDNPLDPYDNAFAIKTPAASEFLGDNEHFAHQKTSLFGDTAPDWLSQGPDSVRRMRTVDFNDCGDPETGYGEVPANRKQSIIAANADYGVGFDSVSAVPRIPVITNTRDIAAFKRQTVQNQVIPGGANEEKEDSDVVANGAGFKDIWRNPHRHTLKSKHIATLPPYFTVKFCEKI